MRAILVIVAMWFISPCVYSDVIVYAQNFESGVLGPEFSGAGSIQSTQGLSAFGFGVHHLKNDGGLASVLSLTGLLPHTSMTLSFSLAMWDSIDHGSDIFQVDVDSVFVINQTFGNYFPVSGSEGPGVPLTPPTTGVFDNPQYGYNATFRDSARAVSVMFSHSAPTATIRFRFPNSQNAPDEAFGIDNVIVSTNSNAAVVPEPASFALVVTGILCLLGHRRRRRS